MRRSMRRRPSPALVISLIALFVALGGTSYAVTKINGKNIRKGTIPGDRVKKNSITGTQVNEAKLAIPKAKAAETATSAQTAVNATNATNAQNAQNAESAKSAQSAADSARLGGRSPAEFIGAEQSRRVVRKLAFGETAELISAGALALDAVCSSTGGTDSIAVKARTSVAGAVLGGDDDLDGSSPTSFLNPDTAAADRDLVDDSTTAGSTSVDTEIDEGFVMAPDLTTISTNSEGIVLGLNYGGANCVVAGVFEVLKP